MGEMLSVQSEKPKTISKDWGMTVQSPVHNCTQLEKGYDSAAMTCIPDFIQHG